MILILISHYYHQATRAEVTRGNHFWNRRNTVLTIYYARNSDTNAPDRGNQNKIVQKSWYPGKGLSRDWYKDKAVLITGCDSGLGYRCADLNLMEHLMDLVVHCIKDMDENSKANCSLKISAFIITCSLAVHCHSLGMVVIALCHTSTSNAG